jgi:hypothetical protein
LNKNGTSKRGKIRQFEIWSDIPKFQ